MTQGVGLLLFALHYDIHRKTAVVFGESVFLARCVHQALRCFSEIQAPPTTFTELAKDLTTLVDTVFAHAEERGIPRARLERDGLAQ